MVRNSAGNVLMILHRNIWDLPKGMLEQNETVRECAVREVREETGVRNLTAGKEICVTHHTYLSGGVPILKHTHWFEMVCNDEEAVTELVPQVEEEITKAAWLSGDSLKKAMENTYASIRDVLDIANGCR
ncbi:MAG: NUDIX domain-containing protein [Bacteroidales bacterium]|nr:NUDIX domain-containing protein [Bacteroidales bacterium]